MDSDAQREISRLQADILHLKSRLDSITNTPSLLMGLQFSEQKKQMYREPRQTVLVPDSDTFEKDDLWRRTIEHNPSYDKHRYEGQIRKVGDTTVFPTSEWRFPLFKKNSTNGGDTTWVAPDAKRKIPTQKSVDVISDDGSEIAQVEAFRDATAPEGTPSGSDTTVMVRYAGGSVPAVRYMTKDMMEDWLDVGSFDLYFTWQVVRDGAQGSEQLSPDNIAPPTLAAGEFWYLHDVAWGDDPKRMIFNMHRMCLPI